MQETTEKKTMEEQLFSTIAGLRKEGVDFTQQPVVFKWQYEAEKNLHFTLIIEEYNEDEVEITAYGLPTKNDVIH